MDRGEVDTTGSGLWGDVILWGSGDVILWSGVVGDRVVGGSEGLVELPAIVTKVND